MRGDESCQGCLGVFFPISTQPQWAEQKWAWQHNLSQSILHILAEFLVSLCLPPLHKDIRSIYALYTWMCKTKNSSKIVVELSKMVNLPADLSFPWLSFSKLYFTRLQKRCITWCFECSVKFGEVFLCNWCRQRSFSCSSEKSYGLMTRHFNYHPHWHSGDNQSVGSPVPVVRRWLWPGNRTFLEVASMIVTCMVNSGFFVQGISHFMLHS